MIRKLVFFFLFIFLLIGSFSLSFATTLDDFKLQGDEIPRGFDLMDMTNNFDFILSENPQGFSNPKNIKTISFDLFEKDLSPYIKQGYGTVLEIDNSDDDLNCSGTVFIVALEFSSYKDIKRIKDSVTFDNMSSYYKDNFVLLFYYDLQGNKEDALNRVLEAYKSKVHSLIEYNYEDIINSLMTPEEQVKKVFIKMLANYLIEDVYKYFTYFSNNVVHLSGGVNNTGKINIDQYRKTIQTRFKRNNYKKYKVRDVLNLKKLKIINAKKMTELMSKDENALKIFRPEEGDYLIVAPTKFEFVSGQFYFHNPLIYVFRKIDDKYKVVAIN